MRGHVVGHEVVDEALVQRGQGVQVGGSAHGSSLGIEAGAEVCMLGKT
jgi:hypothetical protein